jgi:hypothetical protein
VTRRQLKAKETATRDSFKAQDDSHEGTMRLGIVSRPKIVSHEEHKRLNTVLRLKMTATKEQ